MTNNILSEFGKILIEEVRDRTISETDAILSGHMKDVTSKDFYKKIESKFDFEQKKLLRNLIFHAVDLTIHNFLFMTEQKDAIKLYFNSESGECIDLNKISDGLCGELYSEDGWIKKFSKFV